MGKLVDFHGRVITNAQIQPILWGQEFAGSLGQAPNQATAELRQLLAGPYMRGLSQYRGVLPGAVLDSVVVSSSQPPATITLPSLSAFVQVLVASGQVPDFRSSDQLLYLIFTPPGYKFFKVAAGYHYFDLVDNHYFQYAWVAWDQNTWSGIASHEIVEACTDPLGNGFVTGLSGIEVADICENDQDAFGESDGVSAAAYWSDLDGDCIVPKRVARVTVEPTVSANECRLGPVVGGTSKIVVSAIELAPNWIDDSNLPPLIDPQYRWEYDFLVAKPVGPTNQPSLVLGWINASSTVVAVTITSSQGIKVEGHAYVFPHTIDEANVLLKICRLRKIVSTLMIATHPPKHLLGPDPGPQRMEKYIQHLQSIADQIIVELEQVAALNRKRPSQHSE